MLINLTRIFHILNLKYIGWQILFFSIIEGGCDLIFIFLGLFQFVYQVWDFIIFLKNENWKLQTKLIDRKNEFYLQPFDRQIDQQMGQFINSALEDSTLQRNTCRMYNYKMLLALETHLTVNQNRKIFYVTCCQQTKHWPLSDYLSQSNTMKITQSLAKLNNSCCSLN